MIFKTPVSESIFQNKYAHEGCETWEKLSYVLVNEVCQDLLTKDEISELIKLHSEMKFIAGGRYLYYAGRGKKFYNNCFIFKSKDDSREDWANLSWKTQTCLMTGGGIGNDYSIYREKGASIGRTGGTSSGAISPMHIVNEIGRNVIQGGSRRSALYASLNWKHPDAHEMLLVKDWKRQYVSGTGMTYKDIKEKDFNFPAPLDMTNISLNYDNSFLEYLHGDQAKGIYENKGIINKDLDLPSMFLNNVKKACENGEPGFSFNFFDKEDETGRNACTEVVSADDSDVCNLGSINMAEIKTIEEFALAVEMGIKFLFCGTLRADLPYDEVYKIREKNRRLGLGLMGIHEWLLKRGYRYEVTEELHKWLNVYKVVSDRVSMEMSNRLSVSRPVANRAIAPTGSIGMLASTTTGIEPLYAVAFKRRYLKNGNEWHYQYVIDGTAKTLIKEYGLNPDEIETAIDLASDPERRIKFQADIQDYVDMSISSTINLPEWGSELNNESTYPRLAQILAKYSHRLRGFTCYPDGSRGGQPLTSVSYYDAIKHEGNEYIEEYNDVCILTGKGGTCGS